MLNVVVAAFDNNMSAKTDSIWQYDYGQILQITGIDLPEAYEVHFANLPYTGKTITQIGTADGVSIPDCLLRNGLGVYAFIFLHEGANDGETRYDIIIPVKSRPEPSDEEPTPVEQSAITEAIAALNTAVTEANDAAERAEEASSHSPYIGENGDWYIWDGESWTDSGIQAEGETGPQGPQGPKGDPGEVTQAELDAVKSDLSEVRDIIAQTEPTSTASQNYAVGDYLILNNQLYKVTVAISSGETITPGTNAELITLTSEVKSHGAGIAANASAIATLQTAPYDPTSMYLRFLRTYANGSVSTGGRTFAVDKNKITITATGTNSTYAYINITGSELRTRTGTFANMSLFEKDFAKADWINNVGSANRAIMTAIGNVNKDPNSINNHFVIVTRTYEGDDPSNATITRNAILQFTSSNAVAAILDNYLTGCTDFAIYYCAKRSAYAAGEVIWRIDCIPILDAPTT